LVASAPFGRRCVGPPKGGSRQAVLAGERDWLLARIAETPHLTLRGDPRRTGGA
jgi:hypothetical protein